MLSHCAVLIYDTSVSHNGSAFGSCMKVKLYVLASLVIFSGVVIWLMDEPVAIEELKQQSGQEAPLAVSAIKAIPKQVETTISVFGIVKPRWFLDIISPVSGKIHVLPDDMEVGATVNQDALLTKIVDTSYQYEFATASSRLAQAELELARFQHEQYVAKQVNGGKKLNAFGRFEPHVKYAKAELASARAQQKLAKQRLEDTRILSPFNAIILEKYVTPSQWLNEGDRVFSLAALDSVDINIDLPNSSWQKIALDTNLNIEVIAPSGQKWPASLRYTKPTLNAQTRQRGLVVEVKRPYEGEFPLLPEQQVDVLFKGKLQNNVVVAPATVMTRDSKVWSIIDDKLTMESIELIEESEKNIMFRYVNSPKQSRALVLFPLSTMLEGQRARANFDESGAL